jgi:starch synthase
VTQSDAAAADRLKVALLTREYPPEVYGGAGVHVEYLARELAPFVDLTVHCQGKPRSTAVAHSPWSLLSESNSALQTLSTDLSMAAALDGCQVAHSHTWYANLAGHVGGLLHGIPHVVTTHSLEPQRPWKAEQLGGGYALSSWAEKVSIEGAAAVIAVSEGMRADVLSVYPAVDPAKVHVIYNGIDAEQYSPDSATDVIERYGVDTTKPSVVFVGRITRQKGVPVLLRAAAQLDPEVAGLVEELRKTRAGVIWLSGMLSKREVIQLLSHSTLFACPSVYEPLGIVNLEAMACGTAVVASKVGGIPEVVADGETGLLVPPDDPDALAESITALTRDRDRAKAMGAAGRERAQSQFDWGKIAGQTAELYRSVVAGS